MSPISVDVNDDFVQVSLPADRYVKVYGKNLGPKDFCEAVSIAINHIGVPPDVVRHFARTLADEGLHRLHADDLAGSSEGANTLNLHFPRGSGAYTRLEIHMERTMGTVMALLEALAIVLTGHLPDVERVSMRIMSLADIMAGSPFAVPETTAVFRSAGGQA